MNGRTRMNMEKILSCILCACAERNREAAKQTTNSEHSRKQRARLHHTHEIVDAKIQYATHP